MKLIMLLSVPLLAVAALLSISSTSAGSGQELGSSLPEQTSGSVVAASASDEPAPSVVQLWTRLYERGKEQATAATSATDMAGTSAWIASALAAKTAASGITALSRSAADDRCTVEVTREGFIVIYPQDAAEGFAVFIRPTEHITAGVHGWLLSAPHPYSDKYTGGIAVRMFRENREIHALLLSTLHRKVQDAAHEAKTRFQDVFLLLAAPFPFSMQLHGYQDRDGPLEDISIIASYAKDENLRHPAVDNIRAAWPGQIALYPFDTLELGGTTNVQARAFYRMSAPRTFLHLELSPAFRSLLMKKRQALVQFSECFAFAPRPAPMSSQPESGVEASEENGEEEASDVETDGQQPERVVTPPPASSNRSSLAPELLWQPVRGIALRDATGSRTVLSGDGRYSLSGSGAEADLYVEPYEYISYEPADAVVCAQLTLPPGIIWRESAPEIAGGRALLWNPAGTAAKVRLRFASGQHEIRLGCTADRQPRLAPQMEIDLAVASGLATDDPAQLLSLAWSVRRAVERIDAANSPSWQIRPLIRRLPAAEPAPTLDRGLPVARRFSPRAGDWQFDLPWEGAADTQPAASFPVTVHGPSLLSVTSAIAMNATEAPLLHDAVVYHCAIEVDGTRIEDALCISEACRFQTPAAWISQPVASQFFVPPGAHEITIKLSVPGYISADCAVPTARWWAETELVQFWNKLGEAARSAPDAAAQMARCRWDGQAAKNLNNAADVNSANVPLWLAQESAIAAMIEAGAIREALDICRASQHTVPPHEREARRRRVGECAALMGAPGLVPWRGDSPAECYLLAQLRSAAASWRGAPLRESPLGQRQRRFIQLNSSFPLPPGGAGTQFDPNLPPLVQADSSRTCQFDVQNPGAESRQLAVIRADGTESKYDVPPGITTLAWRLEPRALAPRLSYSGLTVVARSAFAAPAQLGLLGYSFAAAKTLALLEPGATLEFVVPDDGQAGVRLICAASDEGAPADIEVTDGTGQRQICRFEPRQPQLTDAIIEFPQQFGRGGRLAVRISSGGPLFAAVEVASGSSVAPAPALPDVALTVAEDAATDPVALRQEDLICPLASDPWAVAENIRDLLARPPTLQTRLEIAAALNSIGESSLALDLLNQALADDLRPEQRDNILLSTATCLGASGFPSLSRWIAEPLARSATGNGALRLLARLDYASGNYRQALRTLAQLWARDDWDSALAALARNCRSALRLSVPAMNADSTISNPAMGLAAPPELGSGQFKRISSDQIAAHGPLVALSSARKGVAGFPAADESESGETGEDGEVGSLMYSVSAAAPLRLQIPGGTLLRLDFRAAVAAAARTPGEAGLVNSGWIGDIIISEAGVEAVRQQLVLDQEVSWLTAIEAEDGSWKPAGRIERLVIALPPGNRDVTITSTAPVLCAPALFAPGWDAVDSAEGLSGLWTRALDVEATGRDVAIGPDSVLFQGPPPSPRVPLTMARLEQDVARLLQNAAPTKDWRSSAARVLAELAEFNSGAEGGAARLLSGRLFTVLDWEPIRQFDEMHKMEFVSERCARFSPASDAVRHILAAPSWAQEAAAYLRPGRSSVWSAGPFPKTMSISVIARAARLPAATGSQPTVLRALLTDERGAQQIKTFTVPLADDWTAELTQLPAGQRVTVLFDLVEPPGSSVAVWIQPRMAEPSALDAVSSPLEAPRTEFFVASQRVPARVSKLGPTVVRLQVMSRSQARTVAVHAEDRDYTVELRQDLFGDCFTAELLIPLLDERRQDILLHPDGSDPVYVRASYPQLSLTAMNGTSAAPDEPLAATSSSVTAVQPDYSCLWSAAAPSVSLVQPLPPPSGGGWQRPFILSLTAGIDRTLIDTGNEPDWIWDGGVQLRTGGGPLRYRLTFEESRNMTRGVSLLSARQRIETRLPCGGRLAGEFGAWLQRDGGGLAMMQAGLTLDRTVKMGRIWSLLPRLGGFSRGLVGRATGSGEDGIDPRVWSSYKERHPRGAFYGIELRAEPRPGWRGWLDASQTLNAQFDKLDYTAWDAGAMFMQRRQGWRATLRYEGRRYGPEALSSGSRSRHLLRIGGGYGWWLPRGRRAELSTDVIRMFDPIEEWGLTVGLRLHFGARGSLDRFLMDEQPLRWEAERAAHHR